MAVSEDQVVEYLEGLNIVQLNGLVKKLEERWGVKAASGGGAAAAPVAAAAAAAPAAEPTEFKVILATVGDKKVNVIKEVRVITGLGLKEAKDLVDGAPSTLKESANKDEVKDIKAKMEAVGATVDVKPL